MWFRTGTRMTQMKASNNVWTWGEQASSYTLLLILILVHSTASHLNHAISFGLWLMNVFLNNLLIILEQMRLYPFLFSLGKASDVNGLLTSCYGFNVKCSPQVCVFEYLVLIWGTVLKGCGTFRKWLLGDRPYGKQPSPGSWLMLFKHNEEQQAVITHSIPWWIVSLQTSGQINLSSLKSLHIRHLVTAMRKVTNICLYFITFKYFMILWI